MHFLRKTLSFLMLSACFAGLSFADALSAKPMRVGPVQNYGALGTNGGKIVSLNDKTKQVMLRGMSLFWSDATGIQYYSEEVIDFATETLGIDVIRYAMGIQYYDSQGNASDPLAESYAYMTTKDLTKLDLMVEAAIKNDIYIIIDWHSHRAEYELTEANAFFATVAEKYKDIPNVIFEIYNEPVNSAWSAITSYANTVSASIRQHSQNLILVGTPSWSQLTQTGGVNATNIAYVFHFYAGTHKVSTFGSRITSAINSGVPVFISEWGTTASNGNGSPDENSTNEWFTFMETNKISNCNWSLRHYTSTVDNKSEESAMFAGSEVLNTKTKLLNASYTTSGTIVKNYLQKNKRNWADSLSQSGSCQFNNITTQDTISTLTNVLKSGCSYTSSDESVIQINGSSVNILSAGFAVVTGNDGSKSVITVEEIQKQSLNEYGDFICRMSGTCSNKRSMLNYTNTGSEKEAILAKSLTTIEGAALSFESSDPTIATIKKATCNNSNKCYGSLNGSTIYFVEFTGKLGSTQIKATAPAISGYPAFDSTITVTYAKNLNRISSKFKKTVVALGGTLEGFLPQTLLYDNVPVTYTFDGMETSPYVTRIDTNLIAGQENAKITILAQGPETENYEAFSMEIVLGVGDTTGLTPIISTKPQIPFRVELQKTGILLHVEKSGNVALNIYSVAGKRIYSKIQNYFGGTHFISTENLPAGSYLFKIKQGSMHKSMIFTKN